MFYVYLLANGLYGTLYLGQTDHLIDRIRKHREKTYGGLTAKYGVVRLVWYETHDSRDAAFQRERQLRKWYRAWKIKLIEQTNPEWRDLWPDLMKPDQPLHPDIVASMAEVAQTSMDPRVRGDERG